MVGVIIPSAIKAAPPIIAGKTNHFFCRRTNAYKEKIPPSPLLSAFKVSDYIFNGSLKSKCPDDTGQPSKNQIRRDNFIRNNSFNNVER